MEVTPAQTTIINNYNNNKPVKLHEQSSFVIMNISSQEGNLQSDTNTNTNVKLERQFGLSIFHPSMSKIESLGSNSFLLGSKL